MEAPFGRYELIRLLDHGGMGEVWLARARGPERVHKTVVLKRIRAERANDDAARARFAEEARVAISLSHPHIVPVFEFGELDGAYFLVMEWLRGGNLGRVAGVDRAPLSWAATALIGTQLCDALAYVHARTNKARRAPRPRRRHAAQRALLRRTATRSSPTSGWRASPAAGAPARCAISRRSRRAATPSTRAPTCTRSRSCCPKRRRGGRPTIATPSGRRKQAKVGVIPDFAGCDDGLAGVLRRALAASAEGRFARRGGDARRVRGAARSRAGRARGGAERDRRAPRRGVERERAASTRRARATQATREATVAASPSRWRLGAAALRSSSVACAVGGARRRHRQA